MDIRDATSANAEAVRTVHYALIIGLGPETYDNRQVEAWAGGCRDADYTAAIEADVLDHVVALRDGVVVGFGSLKWEVPDDYEADIGAEVTAVYVLPSVAREGVGTTIYAEVENEHVSRISEWWACRPRSLQSRSTRPTGTTASPNTITNSPVTRIPM